MKKFFLSISLIAVFAWYVTLHSQSANRIQTVAVAIPETQPKPITRFLRENEDDGYGEDGSFRRLPQTIPAPVPTPALPTPTPVATPSTPAPKPTAPAPVVKPLPVPTPPPAPVAKGMYKDGGYVGNPTDAYYGTLQVKAIVQGGKLADVVFLQHAQDQGTSIEINNYAMPILRNEAIRAQNAQVNIVSGATYTSEAFQISLASALAQAKY